MVWNLWLHLFKEHQIHLHNLFMATTISGLRKEDKKKLKPKLCLLILKLCLGWKFLSVWDWKQIRLQFDCCYRPIKLTVNSSLSDVLSNSRREKFFSKKRVLYFPAFAFVILWRDVDICKNAKSTTPAVKIKGYSFNPVASLSPTGSDNNGNLSTVWQKSTCQQI